MLNTWKNLLRFDQVENELQIASYRKNKSYTQFGGARASSLAGKSCIQQKSHCSKEMS